VAAGIRVVDGWSRAYIEVLLLRAAWRAAQDAEAQIAHWVVVGVATRADLVEARQRVSSARKALSRAQRHYTLEATRVAASRS
jgi:outer membrane protein TolC